MMNNIVLSLPNEFIPIDSAQANKYILPKDAKPIKKRRMQIDAKI